MDEFLAYYTGELAYLRELGAEFAREYPKIAGRLLLGTDECADPHVERLLEAFAFLTARIRRKIDDESSEITDALFHVIYPHFQRPLPSISIVQLQPGADGASLIEGCTVASGTRLTSAETGGLKCSYRTTYPVTLWPIEIVDARVHGDLADLSDAPSGAAGVIQLRLRCSNGVTYRQLPLSEPAFRLRFYLDGAASVVYPLYELLFNRVLGAAVVGRSADGEPEWRVNLPVPALLPVGFSPSEGMYPYPSRSFPGYRLLQEYFAFPEKFLFMDVTGWGALCNQSLGETIDLVLFLDREPPASVKVHSQTFRLGCTPIVNLFSLVTEPIRLDQTRTEYRVIPDVDHQMGHEVYSIDKVSGAGGYLDEPVKYEPFYSLLHGAGRPEQLAYWYATRRASFGKNDPGTDVYLSFVGPEFRPRAPSVEAIGVTATCTNRDLPAPAVWGQPKPVRSSSAARCKPHCDLLAEAEPEPAASAGERRAMAPGFASGAQLPVTDRVRTRARVAPGSFAAL